MSICWHCYWGWPKAIRDIYNEAADKLEAMGSDPEHVLKYGPAHCVWADENFSGDFAFELEGCDTKRYCDDLSDAEIEVVRESIVKLLAVPEEIRGKPEGYHKDDEHPEKYPPPPEWECAVGP